MDGSHYIGCTSDVNKRLKTHNLGKTKSLKKRRPLEIVYKEDYTSATEAFAREKQIKAYKGGLAFKRLLNGSVA